MSIATHEHPILFSSPMVRAILADQKTQTRRVVKPQPSDGFRFKSFSKLPTCTCHRFGFHDGMRHYPCPYGAPGTLLWVRETVCLDWCDHPVYKADDPTGRAARDAGYPAEPKWRPSIHMPRWASRITLEITGVAVERLQQITEKDAIAEGVDFVSQADVRRNATWSRRQDFAQLWNKLNGPRGFAWDSNPWVWVLSFHRVEV